MVLLSWLVDELGCSLFVDDDLKASLRHTARRGYGSRSTALGGFAVSGADRM